MGNVNLSLSQEFGEIATASRDLKFFMGVTLQRLQGLHSFVLNALHRYLKFMQVLSIRVAGENGNIIQVVILTSN